MDSSSSKGKKIAVIGADNSANLIGKTISKAEAVAKAAKEAGTDIVVVENVPPAMSELYLKWLNKPFMFAGMRLPGKTVMDVLKECGLVTFEKLVAEAVLINKKKSKLSRAQRDCVKRAVLIFKKYHEDPKNW